MACNKAGPQDFESEWQDLMATGGPRAIPRRLGGLSENRQTARCHRWAPPRGFNGAISVPRLPSIAAEIVAPMLSAARRGDLRPMRVTMRRGGLSL
jgi:hypothetical protein